MLYVGGGTEVLRKSPAAKKRPLKSFWQAFRRKKSGKYKKHWKIIVTPRYPR